MTALTCFFSQMAQIPGLSRAISTTNNGFLELMDPSVSYPIFRYICNHLGIAEIIALTRTCKQFSGLYQYLLPMLWNFDRRYRSLALILRQKHTDFDSLWQSQSFCPGPWSLSFSDGCQRYNHRRQLRSSIFWKGRLEKIKSRSLCRGRRKSRCYT